MYPPTNPSTTVSSLSASPAGVSAGMTKGGPHMAVGLGVETLSGGECVWVVPGVSTEDALEDRAEFRVLFEGLRSGRRAVVVPMARRAFGGTVGRKVSMCSFGPVEWAYCVNTLF